MKRLSSTDKDHPQESKAPSPLRSAGALQKRSRREFLTQAVSGSAMIALGSVIARADLTQTTIASPNGRIHFQFSPDAQKLRYFITLDARRAIDWSKLSMIVDGAVISDGADIRKVERFKVREKFSSRGVHSTAVNICNGARISIQHLASKTEYVLEVRVFNDGAAFRFIVPGAGSRIPDEASTFEFVAGSTFWFHDFEGHYEGIHKKKTIGDVREGEWAAPPLTAKLAFGGYAAITEAAVIGYPGMGLRANGSVSFMTVLGHALPVSYPFELRFGKSEAKRLSQAASVEGNITTPWRLIMIGRDLNSLVNCDTISNLSPPPDETIFPQGEKTEWIKPGRAVWRYLDGGENTFEGIKEFSRLGGQLGFEYNIVEGIWQRWSEAQLRELVDYSNQQNVKLWFWKHRRDLGTPPEREEFFSLLARLGVAGAKIDFFDHEAKEVIDLYQALLRSAAEHKIMVEFHGSNKPAGESRTWPNELTRESVRGLEYRSMSLRSVHNTTLPFTRFLAGRADYTPVHFGDRRRETSWAHQIATAIVFTSPLMIYGAHPQHILENPAVDLIKTIPAVWDETVVLPPSEIGELAVFARRSGRVWFLGVLNALRGQTIRLPLSFLGPGNYRATLVRDEMDQPAALKILKMAVSRASVLNVRMRAGGGFVARFEPRSAK